MTKINFDNDWKFYKGDLAPKTPADSWGGAKAGAGDPALKTKTYPEQIQVAKAAGVSNCPLCAGGHTANAKRIYELKEMEADHVTAWSKGGDTNESNCQMLCRTHNRAKGNA